MKRDELSAYIRDTSRWPIVDSSILNEDVRSKYLKRESAISAYLAGVQIKSLCEQFQITRSEVYRLVKRCILEHPDGKIWGFRALVPFSRQTGYWRLKEATGRSRSVHGGKSGCLTQLFQRHNEIQQLVDDLFLKKIRAGIIHEARISVKSLHKRFLVACREAGIGGNEYPFTTKHRGRVSLTKYLKSLALREQTRFTRVRHGENAATLLKSHGMGETSLQRPSRPYQRVEFDGHKLDLFCTIDVRSPFGAVIQRPIDRLWLLVIIDCYSRCILGYHLSFNREYSSEDVLLCIKNALTRWEPKKLSIPSLIYPDNAGLPSGLMKEAEGALWDEFACDNAKANLSNRVREKLTSIVGCAVNPGPVGTPVRRPLVERFFKTLEQNGFHRLSSTTGSNHKDSRRNQPEKAALRDGITLSHIEQLIDVLIADYNATEHSGVGYQAPLETMKYFFDSDEIMPRRLLNHQQTKLSLLGIEAIRVVRGNSSNGRRPFINYEGERYSNDILGRSSDLIGTKLILRIDPDDGRYMLAFLPNGQEFGVLTARGVWGHVPHTLEQRRVCMALRNDGVIKYTSGQDPIHVLNDYLERQALSSKKARRNLANFRQKSKQNKQEIGEELTERNGNISSSEEEIEAKEFEIPRLRAFNL
ncbi:MAG TPA: hypothetical protein VF556_02490 [Pyrinomonadaceae bacterium]|jgi:transposase InsO family protein